MNFSVTAAFVWPVAGLLNYVHHIWDKVVRSEKLSATAGGSGLTVTRHHRSKKNSSYPRSPSACRALLKTLEY